MVDGTPVLDIKPYIPQYDYPGIANLDIGENCNINSPTPNVDTNQREQILNSYHMENINERVMDGEENTHVPNVMPHENSR